MADNRCPKKSVSPLSPTSDDKQASSPESEIEKTFAHKGVEKYTGKKRCRRKKKERVRSKASLLLKNVNTKEVTNPCEKEVAGNEDAILSNNTSKQFAEQKTYQSRSEISSSMKWTCVVDSGRMQYDVVSQAVQTDWSWLRDSRNPGHKKDENMKSVSDSLKNGLYGAFGIPENPVDVMNEERKVCKDRPSSNESKYKNAYAKLNRKGKDIIDGAKLQDSLPPNEVGSTNGMLSPSPTCLPANQPNSPVKVQYLKTRGSKENNNSSAVPVSLSPDIQSEDQLDDGLPDLIKYHGEKSSVIIKKPPTPTSTTKLNGKRASKICSEASECAFGNTCQFCGKDIIVPIESSVTQESIYAEHLFCCPEYKHFVHLKEQVIAEDDKKDMQESELIDITPSKPYGFKATRKAARDKAIERLREREAERQRLVQQTNTFQFTRQVKTIQFSLTSTKCFAAGWTTKPETPPSLPPEEQLIDSNIFEVQVNSTLLQKAAVLNQKFYDNGRPFLTIFPDGTGCCFYPNGTVAVTVTSIEKEKFTYIVQSNIGIDNLDNPFEGIIAVFDSTGFGMIHSQQRKKLKLFMNAHGGIEFDRNSVRKKRWQWYFVEGHTSTPPFQPICFSLNKYLSIRVLDQATKIEGHGSFEPDKSEVYLSEKRSEINSILFHLHDALRLPKTARVVKPYPTTSSRKPKGYYQSSLLPPIDSDVYVN